MSKNGNVTATLTFYALKEAFTVDAVDSTSSSSSTGTSSSSGSKVPQRTDDTFSDTSTAAGDGGNAYLETAGIFKVSLKSIDSSTPAACLNSLQAAIGKNHVIVPASSNEFTASHSVAAIMQAAKLYNDGKLW